MPKIDRTLALDSEVLERGERYCQLYGTTLSQLVSDFLSNLPLEREEQHLTPTVRRLLGVAGRDVDEADYRAYLLEKYGRLS